MAAAVPGQNGARHGRRWCIAHPALVAYVHTVGCQNFKGGNQCRLGKRVGVHTDIKRTGNAIAVAVVGNGLADGQNMVFIE